LILTSAECLDSADTAVPGQRAGEVLYAQLQAHQGSPVEKLSVKVMTGDKPEIHDRFLVVDDTVWFSGNSLNNIGERAGVMIKLPDPEPVIESLSAIIAGPRTIKLVEWCRRKIKGSQA